MTASSAKTAKVVSTAEWQTRVDLAAAYRLTAHFGMDELIWNHISARVPGEDKAFLINPMGWRFDEITASSLLKVDHEGRMIDGGETNYTGFVIHSAIHLRRPDVACVMHTHSEGGLAVSALEEGLLPMTQDAFGFKDRVAYHDYEGLSLELEERERLAEDLGDRFVMILRNHGLLTAGRTVGEAFVLMYFLERACRVQMAVLASGRKIALPPEAVRDKAAEQSNRFPTGHHEWPALLRLADKLDPSFRE